MTSSDLQKNTFQKLIPKILIVVLVILLLYSGYNIMRWFFDNHAITTQIKQVESLSKITEVEDDSDTKNLTEANDESSQKYTNVNLLNADLSELKEINQDVIGWLKVNGTDINYPFVQTQDNEHYLYHAFDKSNNGAGWPFLDYRNNSQQIEKNNIIYAHARLNSTMFGSLKNILSENWLKDPENHIVRISTENNNSLWQVFSVYHLNTTSDYLKVDFENDQEFLNFAEALKGRSIYDFKTSVNSDDKILTLSTCYNNDSERLVLHAKLIKYSAKD